jgi:hypothetical protein
MNFFRRPGTALAVYDSLAHNVAVSGKFGLEPSIGSAVVQPPNRVVLTVRVVGGTGPLVRVIVLVLVAPPVGVVRALVAPALAAIPEKSLSHLDEPDLVLV